MKSKVISRNNMALSLILLTMVFAIFFSATLNADEELSTPMGFDLSSNGWTSVHIDWDDVAHASIYSWSVESVYGGEQVANGTNSSSVATVSDLQIATSYIFKVVADADGRVSSEAVFHFATPSVKDVPTYLWMPRGFDRTQHGWHTMVFTWNSVPNASHYDWSVRQKYSGEQVAGGRAISPSISLDGLTIGTSYNLHMVAKGDGYHDSDEAILEFGMAGQAY